MTDQQTAPSDPTKRNRVIAFILSGYLIVNFLWRAFTPAHEYPGRTATYLEMGIDALLIVGLIGVRTRIPAPLFWIALICGIGLFLIRFHSNASWWTGHWSYYLLPR